MLDMKLLYAMLSSVAAMALSSCVSRPELAHGASIDDVANNLRGKQYRFANGHGSKIPYANGEADPVFGYQALGFYFGSVRSLCSSSGGRLVAKARAQAGARAVPATLVCEAGESVRWALDVEYKGVAVYTNIDGTPWVEMTVYPTPVSAPDYQARKAVEAERRSTLAVAEADKQRSLAILANQFRAQIKSGDRFQSSSLVPGVKVTGMVVRVEGDVLFVQFDNATVGGQSTRYVRRDEVWPLDR
jgi:hypothetical protein